MFEIGDSVICVDSSMKPNTIEELKRCCPNWVVEGNKYTIRGFADNKNLVTGVWLEELVNPIWYFNLINTYQESAFGLFRFRKALPSEMIEISEEIIVEEEFECEEDYKQAA
jgi:hypothetical protein